MSEISDHLIMHNKLGTPETDSDGNILAHVTLRSDTVENLKLVDDAGDGELAASTQEEFVDTAIVLLRGSPTDEPSVFMQSLTIGSIYGDIIVAILASDTPDSIDFNAGTVETTPGMLALSGGFILPSLRRLSLTPDGVKPIIRAHLSLTSVAPATCSGIRIFLEQSISTVWTEITGTDRIFPNDSAHNIGLHTVIAWAGLSDTIGMNPVRLAIELVGGTDSGVPVFGKNYIELVTGPYRSFLPDAFPVTP